MSNETLIALLQNNIADLESQLSQLEHRAGALRSILASLKNELTNVEALQQQAEVQAKAAQQLSQTALQNAQHATTALNEQRDELNAFILHTTNQLEALALRAQKAIATGKSEIPHDEELEISNDIHEVQIEMAEQDANEEQAIEELEPQPIQEQPLSHEEEIAIQQDLEQARQDIASEPESEQNQEPVIQQIDETPQPDEEPIVEIELEPEKEQQDQGSIVPKIDDIKSGISIGDRFLFQRQLFKNNGELMNKTIAKLNSLKSLEQAIEYCDNNFNWDKESNAYELFLSVLRRRF